MQQKEVAPLEDSQNVPSRDETLEEYKSRIGRAGGTKRTENLFRRQAEKLGLSYEEYLEKREAEAKSRRVKLEARRLEIAQAKAQAERLGLSLDWLRSPRYKKMQMRRAAGTVRRWTKHQDIEYELRWKKLAEAAGMSIEDYRAMREQRRAEAKGMTVEDYRAYRDAARRTAQQTRRERASAGEPAPAPSPTDAKGP